MNEDRRVFDPSKIVDYPLWVRLFAIVWIIFTCFMASTPLWVKRLSDAAHLRVQDAGIFTTNIGGQVIRMANFGFKNTGKHSVRNVSSTLVAVDTAIMPPQPVIIPKTTPEIFEAGHDFTISLPILWIKETAPPALFLVRLEYEDAVTGKRIKQTHFFKWNGATNGVFVTTFAVPSTVECDTIAGLAKNHGISL